MFMAAATGERIVAFGRVGKSLENPFLRPFCIFLGAPAEWRQAASCNGF
jgi:hypothetical protein